MTSMDWPGLGRGMSRNADAQIEDHPIKADEQTHHELWTFTASITRSKNICIKFQKLMYSELILLFPHSASQECKTPCIIHHISLQQTPKEHHSHPLIQLQIWLLVRSHAVLVGGGLDTVPVGRPVGRVPVGVGRLENEPVGGGRVKDPLGGGRVKDDWRLARAVPGDTDGVKEGRPVGKPVPVNVKPGELAEVW